MRISAGEKLGPYEIVALIGKGGMGEVYRARDSRIGRDVALKTSVERFSERFEREARAIASLNHPNVCTLYDVGPNYLVMELIDGPTLADRLKEDAIPIDEALKISAQIADALQAAHEKGIIHRDLKPGNIKIRPDGTVKVLDFGLAKVGGPSPARASEDSPTLSVHETQAGLVLGTAAYMSPEQAKGKPVDKSTDIWAFGVLLYEMLTGEQLHQGETISETLASVLKEAPDLNRVPAKVRPLLRSCLQKDPKQRLRDIADSKVLLDLGESAGAVEIAPQAKSRAWMWAAIAVPLVVVIGLALFYFRAPPPFAPEVRSQIPQPEGLTFNPGTTATISPDGRWLAFPAVGPDSIARMYARSIDSLEVKPLPGSEGIIPLSPPPFWSYDSRYVVYGAFGKLKKSEVTGTPAQTIADIGRPFVQGGTWSHEGVIVYANNSNILMQVSEAGGTPMPVTALTPDDIAHRWPQFLPDGRRFLYLRVSRSDKTGVYVGSLDSKPEEQSMQPLVLTDRQAWWTTSETSGESYLLIQREATLLAQPFDTKTLKLTGAPVPVANEVGSFSAATAGLWSVSRNGTLLYRSGGTGLPQLTWRDLSGNSAGTVGEPGNYANPALSPDGTRIAFAAEAQGNQDIWIRDLAHANNTKLTFDPGRDFAPVWSPDSKRIVFASNRAGHTDLYEKNADNSGEERLLYKSEQNKLPSSWSRDSKYLLFQSLDPKTQQDIWVLSLDTLKPFVFLKTEFQEQAGDFSPDGHWIVYMSNASGGPQVYVRPFSPDPASTGGSTGPQWLISTTDGALPKWSSDGKRLFYISLNGGAFMAVDVSRSGSSFQSGPPRRLFGGMDRFPFSTTPNGDRFLFLASTSSSGTTPPFTMVLNWMSRLKQ
jgi:serine/threonine protein kinase